MKYNIHPVPKPRMTQRDKWMQRPAVMQYWKFKDDVRDAGIELGEVVDVVFHVPMPKSWSKNKKLEMLHQPHQQKPDIDNYLKALLDAVLDDDSHVFHVTASKYWAVTGSLEIGWHLDRSFSPRPEQPVLLILGHDGLQARRSGILVRRRVLRRCDPAYGGWTPAAGSRVEERQFFQSVATLDHRGVNGRSRHIAYIRRI